MKSTKRNPHPKLNGAATKLVRNLARKKTGGYVFKLYVAGSSSRSARAIMNIRQLCEEYLPGRYRLEVIDAYQQPELLKNKQIIAAPTLVRELPLPLRRFIGDLSNKESLIAGLELEKEKPS